MTSTVATQSRPTPAPPPVRRKRTLMGRAPQDTRASAWNYLMLTLILAVSIFPLYWMFVIATATEASVAKMPPQLIPGSQLLVNLHEVFAMQDVFFTAAMVNSAIVAVTVTFSQLLFCSLAGFAFAKLRFRGSNALMVFILATVSIPNQLGIVALYIVMGKLEWNGTLLAVIVPGLVSAFGVFYMRQFIVGAVPDELVESARVDGASTLRIYWNVVLPAIRPALAVLGLLTFVATWNDFQWPLITFGGNFPYTSMVALSKLASGNYVIYRRVLAGAFVATVPLIIMLFVGGKQVVRGIMEGAVKA